MNRASSPALAGLLCISLLLTVAVSPLLAQRATGDLYGTAVEVSGELLPGARVELTGVGAPRHQNADSSGGFRFLGLDPGRYALRVSLDGFSTVERESVTIEAGRNTTLEVQLTRAVNEVLTVTGESPLLDERTLVSGVSVNRLELETIPTARDPWAVMHQTPGVWVNQVNVGGGQSGQQPGFRGLGISMVENDWNMDGVQISDMAFTGASPTYYDFDQFEEIQITTGGNDITRATGGVAVNLVTRRGTNEFRGSARFLLTDGAGYFGVLEQADSGFDSGKLGPGQEGFVPNRIDRIEDLGFEAGGPAWRDRLWFWAAWGQTDINRITGSGQNDRTVLENAVIKLNAQIVDANSFVGSYNSGTKYKWGRGAEPSVDPSATYDQRGPTGVTKLEDTHVFGSNLFLSGQYSFLDGGYALSAQGGCGPDQPAVPFPGGEANVDENDYLDQQRLWLQPATGRRVAPHRQRLPHRLGAESRARVRRAGSRLADPVEVDLPGSGPASPARGGRRRPGRGAAGEPWPAARKSQRCTHGRGPTLGRVFDHRLLPIALVPGHDDPRPLDGEPRSALRRPIRSQRPENRRGESGISRADALDLGARQRLRRHELVGLLTPPRSHLRPGRRAADARASELRPVHRRPGTGRHRTHRSGVGRCLRLHCLPRRTGWLYRLLR